MYGVVYQAQSEMSDKLHFRILTVIYMYGSLKKIFTNKGCLLLLLLYMYVTDIALNLSIIHFPQNDTNMFQGILITDGDYSYAVFINLCGSTYWDFGVIGWSPSFYIIGESNSDNVACADADSFYSTLVYRLDDSESSPSFLPHTSIVMILYTEKNFFAAKYYIIFL